MKRPKSFLRTPSFIVLVTTLLLFLLYASLQGHQGNAVHLFRADRNIYVSMEEFGQVVQYEVFAKDFASLPAKHALKFTEKKKIFTLTEPVPPKTLALTMKGELAFPGSVVSTALYSNTLFVVDTLSGIYRHWEGQPEDLTQPDIPFFGARDVAVTDGYTYVAGGEAGIYVYSMVTPTATLVMTGFLDTPGIAEALVLTTREVTDRFKEPDIETGRIKTVTVKRILPDTLFVADGEEGVVVLDLKEPITPTKTVTISRVGYVHDILLREDYLYVSQGVKGWSIVNVEDPASFVEVIARETKGEVRDIAVNSQYIAVADGNNGLLIYRNSSDPKNIPQEPVIIDTPGFVTSVELVRNYAIVAEGVEGVRVFDLSNLDRPVERATSATPGEYTLQQVWANRNQPKGSAEQAKFARSLLDLRNEAIMLAAGVILMFLFVSVVTLPAYDLRYWLQRQRGQPVMVEGGQIVSPRETQHAELMRAIHVDSASAVAVLRPNGVRWLGPGLGFLRPRERLGRTIDLRPALLISGPIFTEDPFANEVEGENAQQQRARQVRREQTLARTRDGVAIVPNFLVDVRVAGNPGEGGSAYGYAEENAQLAMQPDVEGYEPTLPAMAPARGWEGLVTNLATHLWMQYLAKYTFEELFAPQPEAEGVFPGQARTGLQRVAWMMQRHLTQAAVPRLDENGLPTGQTMQSPEYAALQQRGLSVSRLQVINLRLEELIRKAHENGWLNAWPARAQQELQVSTARHTQELELAAEAARVRFRTIVNQPYQALQNQPGLQGAPLQARDILVSRVQGTLNLSELSQEMRQQFNDLLASLEGWT